MLSRVADAIFWMSRYIERAESTARFVDVTEQLTLDLPGDSSLQWRSLVSATGDDGFFTERYGRFERRDVLRFLLFDPEYPSSVWSCLRAARENARSVREIISSDMWNQTNRAYHMVKRAAREPDEVLEDPKLFLQDLEQTCYAIQGASMVTMTYNDGWHFMQLGRALERADKTSRIMDVKYFMLDGEGGGAEEDLIWSALLQSVSGLEMYRQRHKRLKPHRVIDFLVFEHRFPRSLRASIEAAERSLLALEATPYRRGKGEPERLLGRLRARLEFGEPSQVLDGGMHTWVDALQRELNGVSQSMNETFFAVGL